MKKLARIAALALVFGLIFAAIISSSIKPADVVAKVWNSQMTLGDPETAVRHYIVYTDLMCPYCNYYGRVIQENDAEFQKYLEDNKIAYEVRVTDMLYESSGIEMSLPAAEAAYCAAKENRFWDYYHAALDHSFTDYYEKGIGYAKTAPAISDMTLDYWKNIGTEIGLGDSFTSCFNAEDTRSEVRENTAKAGSTVSGLPYFTFGKFSTGGFDPSWEWDTVKSMLNQGLK